MSAHIRRSLLRKGEHKTIVGGKEYNTKISGAALRHDPRLSRSLRFSESERGSLGLLGLLPEKTETEDLAIERIRSQIESKATDLERYISLSEFSVRVA